MFFDEKLKIIKSEAVKNGCYVVFQSDDKVESLLRDGEKNNQCYEKKHGSGPFLVKKLDTNNGGTPLAVLEKEGGQIFTTALWRLKKR